MKLTHPLLAGAPNDLVAADEIVSATINREEVDVIVMFTARRLKPGAWEQFRQAWEAGDATPPGLRTAYSARNIRDEDELISFGLFDMSLDEYRRWREDADAAENQRVDRMSAFVEHEYVSGVYEVIDTVDG